MAELITLATAAMLLACGVYLLNQSHPHRYLLRVASAGFFLAAMRTFIILL